MPHYRLRFFELLRARLDEAGVDLDVAHGGAPISNANAGDHRTLQWAVPLEEKRLSYGHRSVELRPTWKTAFEADLLITEDGIRNVDTLRYLAARRRGGLPTAFWGMGRVVHKPVTALERRCKLELQKRVDWYFAYTDGTADWLRSAGFPDDRITAVQNSVDTSALSTARANVTEARASEVRQALGLTQGHTGLFMGALLPRKRLGFLIDACDIVAASDPAFRLLVLGTGEDEAMAEAAAETRPWLLLQGGVFEPVEKSELAAAADFLAVPGTIGLVSVDSFALGLPIVTTDSEWHSVECEYLENGRNSLFSVNTAEAHAATIQSLVNDPALRQQLADECLSDSNGFSVEAMAERFAAGVLKALDAGRVREPIDLHYPTDHLIRRTRLHSPMGVVDVDRTNLDDALEGILSGLPGTQRKDVHLANAWTVALAGKDPTVARALDGAGLTLVDGKPLTWVSKLRREWPQVRQTRGVDVLRGALDRGRATGARHFLLGSTDAVLATMKQRLEAEFPGVEIVGVESPPFRQLSEREYADQDARIVESGATVVWVGLGTPKQDFEVMRLSEATGVVCVAVGAAFDFVAGTVSEAPKLAQRLGLEWLYRLAVEPRRLWRRYLLGNFEFIAAVIRNSKR
jgi:N-acetylglucosaminyldiphosphoundecaprenol N-acetyl-beta-D-mannosaminyltransferase